MIADLSVNHVERPVIHAGFVADRVLFDYGYDLIVRTFDPDGLIGPDFVLLQLKASDTPEYTDAGRFVSLRLDPRDAAAWAAERVPVIVVTYDAGRDVAYWVHFQSATIFGHSTLRVPTAQVLDEAAVAEWRRLKNQALGI